MNIRRLRSRSSWLSILEAAYGLGRPGGPARRRACSLLRVIRRREKKRHRVEAATATPALGQESRSSAKVMSGIVVDRSKFTGACASMRAERLCPPCRPGRTDRLLYVRRLLDRARAADAKPLSRSAHPAVHCRVTCSHKSTDIGLSIVRRPPTSRHGESDLRRLVIPQLTLVGIRSNLHACGIAGIVRPPRALAALR